MPDGLIVMKYDDRIGIDIKARYPKEKIKTTDKTLMHIFTLHEFSKEPGIASLTIDNINFIAYYSGSEKDYFCILMLNILENPEEYEEILEKISQVILNNLEKDKYIKMLPSLFKQIIEFPKTKVLKK